MKSLSATRHRTTACSISPRAISVFGPALHHGKRKAVFPGRDVSDEAEACRKQSAGFWFPCSCLPAGRNKQPSWCGAENTPSRSQGDICPRRRAAALFAVLESENVHQAGVRLPNPLPCRLANGRVIAASVSSIRWAGRSTSSGASLGSSDPFGSIAPTQRR